MAARRRRARGRALSVILPVFCVIVAAIAAVTTVAVRQFDANRDFHPIVVPAASPPPASTASVLAQLDSEPAPSGTAESSAPVDASSVAGVTRALSNSFSSAALGPGPTADVLDPAGGRVLFDRDAQAPIAPASAGKLLVAAAVLTVHHVTDRFSTTVRAGASPGTVVLVGGGDPTLTAASGTTPPAYPGAATISDLAAQVKVAEGAKPVTEIMVDDSLFSGPATAAGWGTDDTPSEYASQITAAMIDGGRDSPNSLLRSAAPDLAAGQALATALGVPAQVVLGQAPAGAPTLATVDSAPVGTLVEQMLQNSDDVIAEVLGRQVALAVGTPATFTGAASAIAATVSQLGIDAGSAMRDASGLSTLDRVPATALAQTLAEAVGSDHENLRPILAGLPVAGWDGTLSDRYTGMSAAGRGVVRAKTGTLGDQGVSTEAGVVTDLAGEQLVFVFVANGAPDTDSSRAQLDLLAAELARCGCH